MFSLSPVPALPRLTALAAACAALLVLSTAGPASAARASEPPPPTEEGSFEGTWARLDPVNQQALSLRRGPKGRGWQLRFLWRTSKGFTVDTGWAQSVEFEHKGHPGLISLAIDDQRSDELKITFAWKRAQEGAQNSKLEESGEVVLYRTDSGGRKLIWLQPELVRIITVQDPILPDETDIPPQTKSVTWIFEKQANRQLEWDEIYW